MLIELYKGYAITSANSRGGKAGRGHNKTTTIRVADVNRVIIKQFAYKLADIGGRHTALQKCRQFVDELLTGTA